jgi:hypothetical protein
MAGLRMIEENMRVLTPHTLNALQKLVMVMADIRKNAGKKTLFGRDKGQETYAKFLATLKITIHSMILDDVIQESTSSAEVASELLARLRKFSLAFPNWQDAYGFATYFLEEQRNNAVATIERLRSSP